MLTVVLAELQQAALQPAEVSPMVLLQVAQAALRQTAMLMAAAVVTLLAAAEQVQVAQAAQAGTRAIPQLTEEPVVHQLL
jgi:hypothetical protein